MGSRALNKPISLQTNLVSRRTYIRNQRRSLQPIAAIPTHDIINLAHIDLDAVQAQINSISHMLTLGYEPVVLPCSSMNWYAMMAILNIICASNTFIHPPEIKNYHCDSHRQIFFSSTNFAVATQYIAAHWTLSYGEN